MTVILIISVNKEAVKTFRLSIKEMATASTSNNTSTNDNDEESSTNKAFECNICLDTAKDAVVSMCGHLFW